jgi:hypothetical protein
MQQCHGRLPVASVRTAPLVVWQHRIVQDIPISPAMPRSGCTHLAGHRLLPHLLFRIATYRCRLSSYLKESLFKRCWSPTVRIHNLGSRHLGRSLYGNLAVKVTQLDRCAHSTIGRTGRMGFLGFNGVQAGANSVGHDVHELVSLPPRKRLKSALSAAHGQQDPFYSSLTNATVCQCRPQLLARRPL